MQGVQKRFSIFTDEKKLICVKNLFWVQKIFQLKNSLCQNTLLGQKYFRSNNNLSWTFFWGKQFFCQKKIVKKNVLFWNTSLAAKGALTHRLQRRTACKIQNGCQGTPKWRTGSGKVSTPRFLGVLSNFRSIRFVIRALLLWESIQRRKNNNVVYRGQ